MPVREGGVVFLVCLFEAIHAGGHSGPPLRRIHQRKPAPFTLVTVFAKNSVSAGGHSGPPLRGGFRDIKHAPFYARANTTVHRNLRQLAKVINTKLIVVMPGDQPATTRVIAKRNRCTELARFDAAAEKHRHIRQCTSR